MQWRGGATSLAWQREMAEVTIAGRGTIVAEYFDRGVLSSGDVVG